MKKLYRCEATIEVFILAEDEPDQYDVSDAVAEEIRNNGVNDYYCREQKDLKTIPKSWLDGIPYGDDVEDRTISEILAGKE